MNFSLKPFFVSLLIVAFPAKQASAPNARRKKSALYRRGDHRHAPPLTIGAIQAGEINYAWGASTIARGIDDRFGMDRMEFHRYHLI